MLVLYIPYKEDTDLVFLADKMRMQLVNEEVLIFRHAHHELKDIPEDKELNIYVLGHGNVPYINSGKITSDANVSHDTTILTIEEIADRFNMDFLYFASQVSSIKLYFCNQVSTEKDIAEKFKAQLMGKETVIDYFSGMVMTNKTAVTNQGILVPVNQVCRRINKQSEDIPDESRLSIVQGYATFWQSSTSRRRYNSTAIGHDKRVELIRVKRSAG